MQGVHGKARAITGAGRHQAGIRRGGIRMTKDEMRRLLNQHAEFHKLTWLTEVTAELERLWKLEGSAPEPKCEHDMLKDGHTITVTHDLREGMEHASIARCRVCGQQWRHALNRGAEP